MNFVLDLLCA